MTPTPFFASAAIDPAAPRLMLVAYHFPPGQATGALRWQKMSAFVAERGWGLDVLTLDPEELEGRDDSRLAELPKGVRLFGIRQPRLLRDGIEQAALRISQKLRAPQRAPGNAATPGAGAPARSRPDSLARREVRWTPQGPRDILRTWFAWMDYQRLEAWAESAARTGTAIAAGTRPLAVISCGPPHMATHEGARLLANRAGADFVMDLRDPWSLWERLPEALASPLWWALAAHYEARAVEDARLVVANTEALQAALRRTYPEAEDRIIAILNGYDEEPLPKGNRGRRFTVAYTGSIYIDRDPRPLLRAGARVVKELGLTPEDFGIDFMGQVFAYEGHTLETIATQEGMSGYVRVFPPRPRREALQFQADAHVLVSLPQDSQLAVPSKLYEYLRYPAWVLALAEPESASAAMLRGTSADVVSGRDEAGITAALGRHYREHAAGEAPAPIAVDARFSRREQARKLLDAIAGLR